MRFQGTVEFIIDCHIQDIPENGADKGKFNVLIVFLSIFFQIYTTAHFKFVHASSVLAGMDLSKVNDNKFALGKNVFDAE